MLAALERYRPTRTKPFVDYLLLLRSILITMKGLIGPAFLPATYSKSLLPRVEAALTHVAAAQAPLAGSPGRPRHARPCLPASVPCCPALTRRVLHLLFSCIPACAGADAQLIARCSGKLTE